MFKKKYHIYFTYEEMRMITHILLYRREQMLARGNYTDPVDELLIKFTKDIGELIAQLSPKLLYVHW